MRLSRAATYAIYGSAYIAAVGLDRHVPVAEVHVACRIPAQHLAKVLGSLARTGLLTSVRGPGGGFALASPPDQIDLLQIVYAVDGEPQQQNPLLAPPVAQVVDPVIHRGSTLMEGVLAATTLEALALRLRAAMPSARPNADH